MIWRKVQPGPCFRPLWFHMCTPSKPERPDPSDQTMESLNLPVLDYGSPTLPDEMKEQLKVYGVTLVQLYQPDDPTVLQYLENLNTVMARVKPGGGTANGAKNMGGITKSYGGTCTEEVWTIRLDPRAKEIYSHLYPGLELNVGCDAYVGLEDDAVRNCISKADPYENAFFKLTGGSLQGHIDVHPTKLETMGNQALIKLKKISSEFPHSIQGQLVLKDVPKGGAAFICAPGEHVANDVTHFNKEARGDFSTCTPAGYKYLHGKWRAVDGIKAATFILWNSKLPHGNKLADAGVDCKRRGLFICWQPAALVPNEERADLKKRKFQAITNGGSTDHWAGYVPGGNRGHRGSHYSNGKKLTKVIHDSDNPITFGPEMEKQIWENI